VLFCDLFVLHAVTLWLSLLWLHIDAFLFSCCFTGLLLELSSIFYGQGLSIAEAVVRGGSESPIPPDMCRYDDPHLSAYDDPLLSAAPGAALSAVVTSSLLSTIGEICVHRDFGHVAQGEGPPLPTVL
jgi:hypothetical protein